MAWNPPHSRAALEAGCADPLHHANLEVLHAEDRRHSSVFGPNLYKFLMVTNMTHWLGTFDVVTKSEKIRPEATGFSLSKCWHVASVKLPGNDDLPAIVWECCGDMSSRLCSSAARTLSVTGRPSGCPLIWADMLTRPTFSRLIFAEYVPSRLSCNQQRQSGVQISSSGQ